MSRLQGKVAVVTGGSSGIGLATARLFAEHGARVVITGRRHDALEAALGEIGEAAVAIQGDVADLAHHDDVAHIVRQQFGGADIYVANAGVNTITASQDVTIAEFDQQFGINVRGTFFGVQKMAPLLRYGGSLIVVGSLASERVLEGHAVYAGTKAALGAFARSWALELSGRGVRVNMLSPGPTDTAIIEKLGVPESELDGFIDRISAGIPLGRLGLPEELAEAALFLASGESSFVTGVNLRVDGGMALL